MLNNLKDETILAYQSGVGMWAFVLHRITGLALVFYLLLHITVISTSLKGPDAFNQLLAKLTTPLFVVLDLGLLAAILFHGLNGVRIVLFDTGVGIRQQKLIFWFLIASAAAIWFTTLSITLPHILK